MRYDIFSVKIQCSECNTVYTHKGFPISTPECPDCKSTAYELYLSSRTLNKTIEDFEENTLHLVEEYKIRLTFLLLQLKVINKNSNFPFLM